jgi:glycosyltransferase involved in cell wall biosynthesis
MSAVDELPLEVEHREVSRCRMLVVETGSGLWGAQRYLLRLRPLLEAYGIDQVLAAPRDSAIARAWTADGGRHVHLPSPTDRAVRTAGGRLAIGLAAREFWRTCRAAQTIRRLSAQVGADVLHANSHWSHLEVALAARMRRVPCVLHLHEESEADLLGKLRTLAVLLASRSVAVSEAVTRSLPASVRHRTTVIRNGVDSQSLRPAPANHAVRAEMAANPEAPVVLTLSRLDPRKGIDHVIRALAAMPVELSHVQLAVVGAPALDPSNGPRLRQLGAELLGDRVRFLGERSDVAELLCAADVLVLASTQEGLPLSILEAHACGTPVAAYPTAGIPEIISDNVTGLLVRTGDIGDLGRCLQRLLEDPALSARIAAAARARAEGDGDIRVQAAKQASLVGQLVRRRRH